MSPAGRNGLGEESAMRPARPARSLPVGFVLLVVTATRADAMDLQSWLEPEFGKQQARGDYRITLYPDRPVDDQPTDLGIVEHSLTLTGPLYQDARNEWDVRRRRTREGSRTPTRSCPTRASPSRRSCGT
jgi:hypothetical protein